MPIIGEINDTMNFALKTRAAAILVLATVLLAGCAEQPKDGPPGPSAGTSASPSGDSAQTKPEQRRVKGVKVVDPTTIIVTPYAETDQLFGKKFAVHVTNITTPTKGECGYDEALALAKTTLVGNVLFLQYFSVNPTYKGPWIDSKGVHHGILGSRGFSYDQTMVKAGLARVPSGATYSGLENTEKEARDQGIGLWTSCPNFAK